MKASELVEKLQRLIEEHGDKHVTINSTEDCLDEEEDYDIDNWPSEFTLWIRSSKVNYITQKVGDA